MRSYLLPDKCPVHNRILADSFYMYKETQSWFGKINKRNYKCTCVPNLMQSQEVISNDAIQLDRQSICLTFPHYDIFNTSGPRWMELDTGSFIKMP